MCEMCDSLSPELRAELNAAGIQMVERLEKALADASATGKLSARELGSGLVSCQGIRLIIEQGEQLTIAYMGKIADLTAWAEIIAGTDGQQPHPIAALREWMAPRLERFLEASLAGGTDGITGEILAAIAFRG